MVTNPEKFHSLNSKRKILIVDDEFINRELLGNVLKQDYEVIYAENGVEALDRILEYKDVLSLVLLDLLMPKMDGIEVLKRKKEDPSIAAIPVIVLTSDHESEVECLKLGAVDFIYKPYPQESVIKARINRTIELYEDREIINTTERDPLTGLYHRDFFFSYAEQYDQFNKDRAMDAILLDIYHFHMLNERYGRAFGDRVLCIIADELKKCLASSEGIVSRIEADTFLLYCPHGHDYNKILKGVTDALSKDNRVNIQIRMGVYPEADKSMDIERRFDRAKAAADTLRGSHLTTVAFYDDSLYRKEIFEEQLIEDFDEAMKNDQFMVYYQPKFDITGDEPVLTSAEALIRWNHPIHGMIPPHTFIPIFEKNGLIYELDSFVWRSAAKQVNEWYKRFGVTLPVSVNVSRIDMYDPHLELMFKQIIEENEISTKELLLEITESAYTQDSKQIIETVNALRDMGFRIEMDDFGTGYSSLNMISVLPIDVLKLDMQFVKNAFREDGDTGMLEIILDIADYLKVPVIAEGVETKEQMMSLKQMGCDIIQGYYFSKPVPADEFEKFIKK